MESLDEQFFFDRKSSYVIRLKGQRSRIGLRPRDLVIVNRNLSYEIGRPAVVVINGRFQIQVVTAEFLRIHDPESGDFIWGMIQTMIRELE